jgi:hypothetical protein
MHDKIDYLAQAIAANGHCGEINSVKCGTIDTKIPLFARDLRP